MTNSVGQWLLNVVQRFAPVNEEQILKFIFPDNEALTWIVGKTLHYCWLKRTSSMRADLNSCLAFLGAETRILKETKHSDIAKEIAVIINPLAFQL